jgi:antitoxin ParD1/3/4
MPNIERMTIALPIEMADSVRHAISMGDYASSSEVFRDALREWKLKRMRQEQELNAIGTGISQGLEDLKAGNVKSAEAVLSRLERKYRAMTDSTVATH